MQIRACGLLRGPECRYQPIVHRMTMLELDAILAWVLITVRMLDQGYFENLPVRERTSGAS